jgi:hypothetical protein
MPETDTSEGFSTVEIVEHTVPFKLSLTFYLKFPNGPIWDSPKSTVNCQTCRRLGVADVLNSEHKPQSGIAFQFCPRLRQVRTRCPTLNRLQELAHY